VEWLRYRPPYRKKKKKKKKKPAAEPKNSLSSVASATYLVSDTGSPGVDLTGTLMGMAEFI
jgi:hypothetical protein